MTTSTEKGSEKAVLPNALKGKRHWCTIHQQYALKGQRHWCSSHQQYALKGQKLLAQGSALGYHVREPVAL